MWNSTINKWLYNGCLDLIGDALMSGLNESHEPSAHEIRSANTVVVLTVLYKAQEECVDCHL